MSDIDPKIGQRVEFIGNNLAPATCKGVRGTVINDRASGARVDRVLVEFDRHVNGHDGRGIGSISGKDGHCWWVLAKDDIIVIIDDNPDPPEDSKDTDLPPGYTKTKDGFITCPDNWAKGKRLF